MAGITQKSSAAAFPSWSLQKQNGLLKRSENNMKDIIGLSIAYFAYSYWHIPIPIPIAYSYSYIFLLACSSKMRNMN